MYYKKRIIELIEKCDNEVYLELIYRFCRRLIG